ncbi:hypothetical protein [Poriferisphaera corsica]|uniref:hypothetical protein n=1 Tax=Poriferisphaera corsica TaxID=2528020 RepID=UPI0011A2906F|nr:hypothetical protein [Poriferisphaera corsica]
MAGTNEKMGNALPIRDAFLFFSASGSCFARNAKDRKCVRVVIGWLTLMGEGKDFRGSWIGG